MKHGFMIAGLVGLGIFVNASPSVGAPAEGAAEKRAVVEVTSEKQFDELLAKSEILVIDFTADWCGWCKRLKPVLEEVSGKFNGEVPIISVNIDKFEGIAKKYGVRGVPDVRIAHEGKIVETLVGYREKDVYVGKIEWLREKSKKE